jgi:hypothetical protein
MVTDQTYVQAESQSKRGQPGYDPAYKFDFIYKTIINNTNFFTKEADLDLCGDKTSLAHGGCG